MPTFTLASFNICSAHFREGTYTEGNLSLIADHINQSKADVVCLQEVDCGAARSEGVDMPAYLSEHTELKHSHFIKIRDFQGGEYGTKRIISEDWVNTVLRESYEFHPICDGRAYGKGGMRGQMVMFVPEKNRAVAWHACFGDERADIARLSVEI